MTRLTRSFAFFVAALAALFFQTAIAQSVIVPTDPVNEYNPASPPAPPEWGKRVVKWVRTLQIENNAVGTRNPGWNSDVYKAYAYGTNSTPLAFRVQFPKNYSQSPSDTTKYPIIIFLHGQGENDHDYKLPGANYDNQYQLLQGPPQFDAAIRNDKYNGFVLAPQLQDPPTGRTVYYSGILNDILSIVQYMIANNKVDPFHIVVNGLSEGGVGCWDFLNMFPTYVSSSTPMSAPVAYAYDSAAISRFKFTPSWFSQGGLDNHPSPAETQMVIDALTKYGASFKETFYPNNAHDTWYNFWGEADFWPFVNRSYSSNPWEVRGAKSVWPGQPFVDTVGLNPGFTAYQWRRNGVLLPLTSNQIVITTPGIYDARVLRDTIWSDWSHLPATVRTGFYEAENWVAMNGVQKENTTDSSTIGTFGNGQNVGYIDRGDWMDYRLNVYAPGTYTLQLRVAATVSGGQIEIRNSDSAVLATVNVPQTGGWQNWVTTAPVNVTFTTAGVQNIRLKSVAATNWNINWFQFSLPSTNTPLPLKFVYFNSQCSGGAVALQWRTAQEVNTQSFEVQRSTDGVRWNSIGTVAAAGQSALERSYQYSDNTVSSSTNNFYRIVEHDLDGRTTVSSIVRASCSSNRNEFSVSPNPSTGNSALNVSLERATKITLTIVDSKGSMMQQSQLMLPQGNSSLPLNMSNYAQGIYNINIRYNDEMKTIKVVRK